MKSAKRYWTEKELATLRKYFPHRPTTDLVELFDRTASAINTKAERIGLRKTENCLNEIGKSNSQKRWQIK